MTDFELEQEQQWRDGRRTQRSETLHLRYLKHLILQAVYHRSYHTVIALTQILRKYDDNAAWRTYQALLSDPSKASNEGGADTRALAKWRRNFRDLLRKRFIGHQVFQEDEKKEKLALRPGSEKETDWTREALKLFTPWGVTLLEPDRFHRESGWPELQFNGKRAIDELPIEERRIAILISPWHFDVMAKQLELPPTTLQLPQVNETMRKNDVQPPGSLPKFPGLTPDQLNQALIEIAKAGHERQKLHGTQIRICVDGVEQDTCVQVEPQSWLRRGGLSRVSLHPTARRLEFYATPQDSRKEIIISYLSIPSTHVEDGIKWKSNLRLGGGQKIEILIEPQLDEAGSLARSTLTVAYKERPSIVSLREWYRLNTASLNEVINRPLLAGILTFVFVMVVGAAGYLSLEGGWNFSQKRQERQTASFPLAYQYEKDDLDRAIQDSTHLISLNPKDAVAYNTRGSAYARKGDLEAAIQDFTKSILLNPKDASVYLKRAEAYRALGREVLADTDEKRAQYAGQVNDKVAIETP